MGAGPTYTPELVAGAGAARALPLAGAGLGAQANFRPALPLARPVREVV